MSVALVLVAHGDLGSSLLRQAKATVEQYRCPVAVLEVEPDADPEAVTEDLRRLLDEVDQGQGIVLLTDIFGATPSNVAHQAADQRCTLVHGVNLAMLLRAHCYHNLPHQELAQKLVDGGRQAIFAGDAPTSDHA